MSRTVYYDWQGNEIERPKADPVPMTNADRIRGMTDEELAELFCSVEVRECDMYGDYDPQFLVDTNRFRGYEDVLEWLKSTAEVQK